MNVTESFLAHFNVSTITTSKIISIGDSSLSAILHPFTLDSLLMNEPKEVLVLSITTLKLVKLIKNVLTFRKAKLLRTT